MKIPTTTPDTKTMILRVMREGCGCGGCIHMRAAVTAVLGGMEDPQFMSSLIDATEKADEAVKLKIETSQSRHAAMQAAVDAAMQRAMGQPDPEGPEPEKKVTH